MPASPEQTKSRQSSAAATQNVCRTARHSTAATQNVCRTAGHLPLVQLGIHPGHYRRMSGGNSYVFEMSGGNSHTIQQVPSRKRMQIRQSFSNERKTAGHSERQDGGTRADPPIIRSEQQDECMQNRRPSRSAQAPRRQLAARRLPAGNLRRPTPDRPREAHGAVLVIAKRTNTCQPLAIGQSAGCIAAARHRSKWRAAA